MRVLFICTGNTCRSPMAEELAKQCFPKEIEVISAGIGAQEGDHVSAHAVEVLKDRGLDISRHRARRLTQELLASADYIFTMTGMQAEYLTQTYPRWREKVLCLGHLNEPKKDIIDPWGGSLVIYQRCAQDIESSLQAVLEYCNNETSQ